MQATKLGSQNQGVSYIMPEDEVAIPEKTA
jgi:hypothetical protein